MGFGDSRPVAPNRYNRILYGFDARYPGELRFGDFMQNVAAHPDTSDGPPCWATEWRNAASDAPVLVYFNGVNMIQVIYNAAATRGAAFAQRATGGCFHDDGAGVQRVIIAQAASGNIESRTIANAVGGITGTIVRVTAWGY